jgi:signal transduction histidine kinase
MSAPPVNGLERAEERAREIAAEQAALRQVAAFVARESSPDRLFAVVAEQVARIFAVPHVRLVRYDPDGSVVVGGFGEGEDKPFPIGSRWALDSPGVVATVRQTGRAARVEDYALVTGEVADVVRGAGMRSAVASPIAVESRLWGAMVLLTPRHEPLREDTEARLTDFTELIATAIANAESRRARAVLTEEQVALRRMATMVAEAAPPAEIFSAVSNEVAAIFHAELVVVGKFDGDPAELLVVGVGDGADEPVLGSRWKLDDALASAAVYRTGLPARLDHPGGGADLDVAAVVERIHPVATVAVPIKVEGRLWGAMIISTLSEPLPPDTDGRLQSFTDLIATALANAEARGEVERLAEEQAALRRVAVLVAQQPSPSEVFAAVTQAVGLLLDADLAVLHVFPGDGTATTIASWSGDVPMLPIETRFPLDGDSLAARIFETGAPARMYSYDEAWERETTDLARSLRLRSAVGAPILVEGKLWGALMAATRGVEPWAENAETRIAAFTELVATAIANAESREARAVLTEEQAALRRVATLVARGVSPQDLFEAVAEEVGRVLPVGSATMGRFEPDGSVTTVASWSTTEAAFPTGRRWPTEGTNVAWMVLQTGRSARLDDFSAATDPIGVAARESGIKSAVGSPIVVEGHLWGVMTATSTEGPLPPDTEARLASFTELVATAIANAESSAEIAASRRRVVTASDDARRRIVRDLHDGAQQRLVHTVITLKLAQQALAKGTEDGTLLVQEAIGQAQQATAEVRELAHGILPSALTHGGLRAGIDALGLRTPVPVEIDVSVDRLPAPVEATAYFVVAEALTNVAKHSSAGHAVVVARIEDGMLRVEVRDDGVGGARPDGTGLVGLQDRVEALGGTITIDSSAGSGTCVVVTLPIATEPDQEIENFPGPTQELGSPTSPA